MITVPSTSLEVGVDVVEISALRSTVGRRAALLRRRVLTIDESMWCAEHDGLERLATCLAVKEAAIKVVGGRPHGFRWDQVGIDPALVRPARSIDGAACRAIVAASPTMRWTWNACELSGAMLNGWHRCASLFGSPGWRGMSALCGCDGEHAIAVIIVEQHGPACT